MTRAALAFQIRILLPPGYARAWFDRGLIEEMIQMHNPAHTGDVLEVQR